MTFHFLFTMSLLGITGVTNAQIQNEVQELELPRVSLISTTDCAPFDAHVAGMYVYNTATVGDVKPDVYYNDGTQWIAFDLLNISDSNPNIYTIIDAKILDTDLSAEILASADSISKYIANSMESDSILDNASNYLEVLNFDEVILQHIADNFSQEFGDTVLNYIFNSFPDEKFTMILNYIIDNVSLNWRELVD